MKYDKFIKKLNVNLNLKLIYSNFLPFILYWLHDNEVCLFTLYETFQFLEVKRNPILLSFSKQNATLCLLSTKMQLINHIYNVGYK